MRLPFIGIRAKSFLFLFCEMRAFRSDLSSLVTKHFCAHKTNAATKKTQNNTKPNKMSLSTTKLLSLVLTMAAGYTTTSNRPFARPFGIEDYSSSVLLKNHQPSIKTRQTYDLGLGKNKPVNGKATILADDITQFLVEHESVRPFPAPVQEKKHPLPKVQPERKSKDTLHIKSHHHTAHLPRISRNSGEQLDVNTIWVEMMIHSEKMKLIPV